MCRETKNLKDSKNKYWTANRWVNRANRIYYNFQATLNRGWWVAPWVGCSSGFDQKCGLFVNKNADLCGHWILMQNKNGFY